MWMAVKRGIVVAIGLLIQILLTLFIYLKFGEFISIIQVVYGLLSIIIVLMIIKYSKRLSSDLIWILLIMLFPLIGTLLYIILSNNMKNASFLYFCFIVLLSCIFKSKIEFCLYRIRIINLLYKKFCRYTTKDLRISEVLK